MNREIKSLPMVALRGMTIMPEMVVHFDVSREKSIAAIQEAMAGDQKIFLLFTTFAISSFSIGETIKFEPS